MLKLVPTVRTESTEHDFIKALLVAWFELTKQTPKKESIGVLHAQHQVETGGYNCWNNNIGNIKAVNIDGQTIEYCILTGVWEIDKNGKKVYLKPSDPGSRFLSFNSLADGAKYHLDVLKNKKFATAWPFIEKGDYKGFSKALKSKGYYTATEASYTSLLKTHFDKYMKDDVFETVLNEFKAENSLSELPPTSESQPQTPDDYTIITKDPNTKKTFWDALGDFFKWVFGR